MIEEKTATPTPTCKKLLLSLVIVALLGSGGYIYITRFHNPCENKYLVYEAVKDYRLTRAGDRTYTFPSINDAKEASKYYWAGYQYKGNCVHHFDMEYATSNYDDWGSGYFHGSATYQNSQWTIVEDKKGISQ